MKRSTLRCIPAPIHVAIIMDGNGRWATTRTLPRSEGHKAGARAVSRIVEAAVGLGLSSLSLYAFSSDNWQRPDAEVQSLMGLFRQYLVGEVGRCVTEGIRLNVVGRRDRLPLSLRAAIAAAEKATAAGRGMRLRIAVDYSSRDAILLAARRLSRDQLSTRERFAHLLAEIQHERGRVPDVDLLIRTGGEQRLSDFLLWECAYAELYFTATMWPDFGPDDLALALASFRSRLRRFGAVAPRDPQIARLSARQADLPPAAGGR